MHGPWLLCLTCYVMVMHISVCSSSPYFFVVFSLGQTCSSLNSTKSFSLCKKKKTPRFLPMHILCFIDQLIKIYNIILYIFIPFIYPLPSKLHALKVSMRHWFCEDAKRTFDYFSHHFNRALSTDPCQLPARKFTSA